MPRPRRTLAALALGAAAVAPSALAHVVPTPDRVPAGVPTAVTLVAQEEREGHSTARVKVAAPGTVKLRPLTTTAGTLSRDASGSAVTWNGPADGDATFEVELTPGSRAGRLDLDVAQTYDDGVVRRWDVQLVIAPPSGSAAPRQHLGRALAIGAIGLVLVGGSVAVVHQLRR